MKVILVLAVALFIYGIIHYIMEELRDAKEYKKKKERLEKEYREWRSPIITFEKD